MAKRTQKRVFLICPVRKAERGTINRIKKYIKSLKSEGFSVYWPYRDTDQNDPVGTRILTDNTRQILSADEIHVWYNSSSAGSHFDLGVVFALLLFGCHKKIVLANKNEVKIDEGIKSFPAVIEALENGFRPKLSD